MKKGSFKWTIYGFIWLIPTNIKRIHDPFRNCRWRIELPKTEPNVRKGETQSKDKMKKLNKNDAKTERKKSFTKKIEKITFLKRNIKEWHVWENVQNEFTGDV